MSELFNTPWKGHYLAFLASIKEKGEDPTAWSFERWYRDVLQEKWFDAIPAKPFREHEYVISGDFSQLKETQFFNTYDFMTEEHLMEKMQQEIDDENYEEAARIRNYLNSKNK